MKGPGAEGWLKWTRSSAQRNREQTPRGHVAAALEEAERLAVPLVVPALEAKLQEALPGAWIAESFTGMHRYRVHHEGRTFPAASSKREAIDRALTLAARR